MVVRQVPGKRRCREAGRPNKAEVSFILICRAKARKEP